MKLVVLFLPQTDPVSHLLFDNETIVSDTIFNIKRSNQCRSNRVCHFCDHIESGMASDSLGRHVFCLFHLFVDIESKQSFWLHTKVGGERAFAEQKLENVQSKCNLSLFRKFTKCRESANNAVYALPKYDRVQV